MYLVRFSLLLIATVRYGLNAMRFIFLSTFSVSRLVFSFVILMYHPQCPSSKCLCINITLPCIRIYEFSPP